MPFFHSQIPTHMHIRSRWSLCCVSRLYWPTDARQGPETCHKDGREHGEVSRGTKTSLRAGNGKFRTLHILVHLASWSTFTRKCACGQSERSWRRIRIYASNLSVSCTCRFRLRPELTHRNEQRVLCVFKQLLSTFAPAAPFTATPNRN
jgi:hypothetical protein